MSLGVPQGSVLGTLLFVIYINDIKKVIKNSEIRLFADDALVYIAGTNVNEIKMKLEQDLNEINKWLKINKLKLNTSKTKLMMMNREENINISIDGEVIESVDEIKYLGVIIDNKLKFKSHIEYITKKVASKVGFFKRIRKRVTILTAVNIYNTIVKPHFEYCSTLLYLCNVESIERLQKLQNRAMRTILLCDRFTSVKLMLNALKWINVKDRIELNVLVFIFKIKNGMTPKYLQDKITLVEQVQPYTLRNADVNFRLGRFRLTSSQNSLIYKGFKKFNELHRNIKTETNLRNFKRECIKLIQCASI